jgi:hypothetical protein
MLSLLQRQVVAIGGDDRHRQRRKSEFFSGSFTHKEYILYEYTPMITSCIGNSKSRLSPPLANPGQIGYTDLEIQTKEHALWSF